MPDQKLDLRQIRLRDRYLSDYPNTIYGLGEWRRYDCGIWIPVPEAFIRQELCKSIVEQKKVFVKVDNGLISSVLNIIKWHTIQRDETFDADEHLLVFEDCTLNIKNGERRGHLPENYRTSKLPFAYDGDAWSQTWHDFLQDTVPETRYFLQEFAGYTVTTSTRYEIAAWLYGLPGGGKSTFIAGLEAMLGSQCCVLGLSDIETSNFGLTNLPGKTLAISTEQPSHFIKSAHIVNALISGERINVDRKYRDPIMFQSHCKLLWAMNELPRVDDRGAGIFRRVKLVHMPPIDAAKRDPRVKEDIQRSGMAILNWALEGLKRLQERGRFEIPPSVEAATEHYKLSNDIVKIFLEERCEVDQSHKILAKDLYTAYSEWCKETGHMALSASRLTGEMERHGFTKAKLNNIYYRGLKLVA